jgi:predicted TIM-barrel fold metal-dependent hydrolase
MMKVNLMVIDFHTHIFPSAICQNRKQFFPSESAFELLYQSSKSKLIDAIELLNAMDENEVDESVIFGFPWKNPETFKMHNDYIMETIQKYPHRFTGLGCFDPSADQAAAEAERCLDGGLAGIGELAFYQTGIDELALKQLTPIMNICTDRDLPVLIHTNEPVGHAYHGKAPMTLAQIYRLIKRFSETKIVLAHWGGGLFFYSLMKRDVKETLTNVFFDTAASPFLYDPEIYQLAVSLLGDDKILFGSDYPLLPPVRYFGEIRKTGLAKSQIDKICGGNAMRLLTSAES